MKREPRRWPRWLAVALVLTAIPALLYRSEELLVFRTITRSDDVLEFARGSYSLPESFRYGDRSYDTEKSDRSSAVADAADLNAGP